MEVKITSENFETEVIKSGEPVLVDFWASWCGPCKMLMPIMEELSQSHKIGKVNVDEQPELAGNFGIRSIPTVILFKDGKPASTSVGLKSKAEIEKMFNV